jgi:hypothetical protein
MIIDCATMTPWEAAWEYHGSGEFWFWRPEDAVFFR